MSSRALLRSSLVGAVGAAQPSLCASGRHRHFTGTATAPIASQQASTSHHGSTDTDDGSGVKQCSSSTSTSSTPNAATLLLLDTVPFISQYGFTSLAYLRSSPAISPSSASFDSEDLNKRLRILSTLFPGPESTFSTALFTTWNKISDLAVIHSLSPSQVVDMLRSDKPLSDDVHKPVRMQPRLSEEQEKESLNKVAQLIEERLALTWQVKAHLKHGLTSLCTASPTTSTLHSIFPHETVLPNLPNPAPLLGLSSAFVSKALTHPKAQHRTGWIDPDGPEWYAVRTRLTAAYTATTLHMASDSIVHFQDSQALFRRIVQGRESGLVATFEALASSAKQWLKWGGRGWLGTFRSLGL